MDNKEFTVETLSTYFYNLYYNKIEKLVDEIINQTIKNTEEYQNAETLFKTVFSLVGKEGENYDESLNSILRDLFSKEYALIPSKWDLRDKVSKKVNAILVTIPIEKNDITFENVVKLVESSLNFNEIFEECIDESMNK